MSRESGHSAAKHRELDAVIHALFPAIKAMITKHSLANPTARLFDLHGGHGDSARLLYWAACRYRLPFELWVFEQRPKSAAALQKYFSDEPRIHVVPGDHASSIIPTLRALRRAGSWTYGLVFVDPCDDVIPLDVIDKILHEPGHKTIDVMIHLAATSRKRVRGAGFPRARLLDELRGIDKEHAFLRVYPGAQQWHFYFATNWDRYTMLTEWMRAESPEGQTHLIRLDSTRKEQLERSQLVLPTVHMPNILRIPDSARSGISSLSAPGASANGVANDPPPTRTM